MQNGRYVVEETRSADEETDEVHRMASKERIRIWVKPMPPQWQRVLEKLPSRHG